MGYTHFSEKLRGGYSPLNPPPPHFLHQCDSLEMGLSTSECTTVLWFSQYM